MTQNEHVVTPAEAAEANIHENIKRKRIPVSLNKKHVKLVVE